MSLENKLNEENQKREQEQQAAAELERKQELAKTPIPRLEKRRDALQRIKNSIEIIKNSTSGEGEDPESQSRGISNFHNETKQDLAQKKEMLEKLFSQHEDILQEKGIADVSELREHEEYKDQEEVVAVKDAEAKIKDLDRGPNYDFKFKLRSFGIPVPEKFNIGDLDTVVKLLDDAAHNIEVEERAQKNRLDLYKDPETKSNIGNTVDLLKKKRFFASDPERFVNELIAEQKYRDFPKDIPEHILRESLRRVSSEKALEEAYKKEPELNGLKLSEAEVEIKKLQEYPEAFTEAKEGVQGVKEDYLALRDEFNDFIQSHNGLFAVLEHYKSEGGDFDHLLNPFINSDFTKQADTILSTDISKPEELWRRLFKHSEDRETWDISELQGRISNVKNTIGDVRDFLKNYDKLNSGKVENFNEDIWNHVRKDRSSSASLSTRSFYSRFKIEYSYEDLIKHFNSKTKRFDEFKDLEQTKAEVGVDMAWLEIVHDAKKSEAQIDSRKGSINQWEDYKKDINNFSVEHHNLLNKNVEFGDRGEMLWSEIVQEKKRAKQNLRESEQQLATFNDKLRFHEAKKKDIKEKSWGFKTSDMKAWEVKKAGLENEVKLAQDRYEAANKINNEAQAKNEKVLDGGQYDDIKTIIQNEWSLVDKYPGGSLKDFLDQLSNFQDTKIEKGKKFIKEKESVVEEYNSLRQSAQELKYLK